jgi:hypothetical protein
MRTQGSRAVWVVLGLGLIATWRAAEAAECWAASIRMTLALAPSSAPTGSWPDEIEMLQQSDDGFRLYAVSSGDHVLSAKK